jgi:multiple sugar transport system ATP-binding protein
MYRYPHEFSGGQRQRVAVGRAIVRNPKVFLFDEPLSNLDAKLRTQMRVEIAELHKKLGTTIVYVTHDQVEAMTLGQRIVVMDKGVVQQIASPEELYNSPVNMFVAGFMGAPSMNFIECKVDGNQLVSEDTAFRLPDKYCEACGGYNGRSIILGIRPEDINDCNFAQDMSNSTVINANVKVVEKLGSENLVYFDKFGITVTAKVVPQSRIRSGETARLCMNMEKIHLFDKDNGKAL